MTKAEQEANGRKRSLGRAALAIGAAAVVGIAAMAAWQVVTSAEGEDAPRSAFSLSAQRQPVPNIAFVDADGNTILLADFRGQVVLLNIWATWCPPCREEMPALDRLQEALGGHDFQVVPLSIDSDGLLVEEFYLKYRLESLAIYLDAKGKASSVLGVAGVPTTLLIDRRGREIGRRVGPAEWDGEAMIAEIRRHLDEAGPAPVASDSRGDRVAGTASAGQRPRTGGNADQIRRGKAVYAVHCAACHGEQLQGAPDWQQKLPNGRMPAPPHDASGHTWHHPDDMLFGIVERGMAPFAWPGYESDMPAFGGILNVQEIRAVLAFIKSTWPEGVRAHQARVDAKARRRASEQAAQD